MQEDDRLTTEQAKKTTTTKARNGRSSAAKQATTEATPTLSPKPEGPAGRFTKEQRDGLLAQAQALVNDGASWTAAAEALGLRPDTLRRWRQSGQTGQTPVQRIRELERENARLRQAVASLSVRVADCQGRREGVPLRCRRSAIMSA